MSKGFVHAKVCHIPGCFNEDITVTVDDSVTDEVLTSYSKSLVWGGNFRTQELTISVVKLKRKIFDKNKTIIPEKFFILN